MANRIWSDKIIALFFAFSSMHASHQKPTALISSLLWQLLEIAPEEENTSILHDLMLKGQPTISDLWMAFDKMTASVLKPVYCIIDGVDESTDPTGLLQRILGFLEGHSNFRFILLGRQNAFQGVNFIDHDMEIQPALTKTDIERVIETEINQSDLLRLPKLREKVSKCLRKKCDGNFLWVHLMIGHLSKSIDLADALKRLNHLPRDLEETYQNLLLGLVDKLEPKELELARKVFAFIVTSQRPLNLNELQRLLSADAMSTCACDSHSIDDHLILQLRRRISEGCGDLIHAINGRLQMVHFSVKEFLVRAESQWSRRRKVRKIIAFRVSLEDAHRWFGAACIEYLEICDYGSPLYDWKDSSRFEEFPFLLYSSTYAMTHIHQSGLPSNSLLEKIDNFVNSDRWIVLLEISFFNAFEYESLHSQDDELDKFASWLGERSNKLFYQALASLKVAIERRANDHGHADLRTEQLRLLLNHLENSTMPTIVEPEGLRTVQSPGPSMNILPILQLVLRNAPLSSQLQIDMLLRMETHLVNVKRLTKPLELLFRIILQKASSMSIYVLLFVGEFYNRVERFDHALEIYFAALQKVKEKEVPVKFMVFFYVGKTYFALDQYDLAIEQLHHAIEGQEKLLGPKHKDTLYTIYWLGIVYHNLEQYEDALKCLTKALAGQERVLGLKHKGTIRTLYRLGFVYYHLKQHENALQHLLKALEREESPGPENLDTFGNLHSLGIVYHKLNEHENALEYLSKALVGYERVLGPEHRETLTTLHWLGIVYHDLEQYEDALQCLTKCLTGQEKVLGPEHRNTLSTLSWVHLVNDRINLN